MNMRHVAAGLSVLASLLLFTACQTGAASSGSRKTTAGTAITVTTDETVGERTGTVTSGTKYVSSGIVTTTYGRSKTTITVTRKKTTTTTEEAGSNMSTKISPVVTTTPVVQTTPYNYNEKESDGSYIKGGESGWKIKWEDDFNGTKLNSKLWQRTDTYEPSHFPEYEKVHYAPDAIYLDGKGNLIMKAEARGKILIGSQVISQKDYDFTYGYAEIRCIHPKSEAINAAFWMMPRISQWGPGPDSGTEVDIYETPYWRLEGEDGKYLSSIGALKGSVNFAVHWGGYGEGLTSDHVFYFPPGKREAGSRFTDEYHVFALKWTPEKYSFYVDGLLAWETDCRGGGAMKVPGYLLMSQAFIPWSGDIKNATLPAYQVVDYVRVYQK